MKVKAVFSVTIETDDENIYTKKANALMKEIGCKAERVDDFSERYEFTVDKEDLVYEKVIKLQDEISRVFNYDEVDDLDDEIYEIIEPDIQCSYIPEYTPEEEKEAVGYMIKNVGYEFEEKENAEYERQCPKCKMVFQDGAYTFKKKDRLQKLNRRKAIFTCSTGRANMFATLPMYEYLLQNGISKANFMPAYFGKIRKQIAGYQFWAENILDQGIFQRGDCDVTEACSQCGKSEMIYVSGRGFQNTYLDWEKVKSWGNVNAAYEYRRGTRPLVYSVKMKELLMNADEKLVMYPVFPLWMKERLDGGK